MDLNVIRESIRHHIGEMQKRGIMVASKWLCEQLIGNIVYAFILKEILFMITTRYA